MLESADLDELEKLKDYLKHDKTKKDIKVTRIVEFSKSYRTMQAVQEKITMAMEHLNEMLLEDIYNSYVDDMNNIHMDMIMDKVTSQIARLQDRATRDNAMQT